MARDTQDIDFELASPQVMAQAEHGMLLFHKPRCPNCMVMKKVAQKGLALSPQMNLGGLDIEDHPEAGEQFQISRVPTLVVFKNGQETARKSGVMKPQELVAFYAGN